MSWSRVGFSSALLLFFFVVQEAAISKINFPIAGFSLYLCVVLGLMALEDRFGAISFGFIAGIVTWQSQDFGIAAVVTAYLVIIFAGSSRLIEVKTTLIALIGYVPGFALYPVIAALAGKAVSFDFFLFFARQFGSGFGAERMRTPGPVLYILPLLVMLVVVHGIYLYKSKKSSVETAELSLSSLIGFTFGLWSLFGFTYYFSDI